MFKSDVISTLGGTVQFFAINHVATLYCNGLKIAGASWDGGTIGYVIPMEFRPRQEVNAPCTVNNDSSHTHRVNVTTGGICKLGNAGSDGATDASYATVTWIY